MSGLLAARDGEGVGVAVGEAGPGEAAAGTTFVGAEADVSVGAIEIEGPSVGCPKVIVVDPVTSRD